MTALLEEFAHPMVEEGIASLRTLWTLALGEGIGEPELVFAPGLARGLNYYTGAIFEVQVEDAPVGSICGGGRYDDLTGIFGMPGVSGVGISFGADRIYDVLEHFEKFPDNLATALDVLILHMGEASVPAMLSAARQCRERGLRTEVYPEAAKLKKQFKYADDRGVPHVLVFGSDEIADGTCTLRDMQSGDQTTEPFTAALDRISG